MAEIHILYEMSYKVTSSTPTHSARSNTNTPFQFQASTEITMKHSTCRKYMTHECRTKFCRRHTGHTGDNMNSKHSSICALSVLNTIQVYANRTEKKWSHANPTRGSNPRPTAKVHTYKQNTYTNMLHEQSSTTCNVQSKGWRLPITANFVLTDSLHPLLCVFITIGCLSWTHSMKCVC